MIKLDSVLPELQRAVEDRVESRVLQDLDAHDLRHLIYKLIERQRAVSINASKHFDELVSAASERHSDLIEAQQHSVAVRTKMLKELLVVLRPAFPSLMGSIIVRTTHNAQGHDKRKHHPLLRGCVLLNGEKTGPVGGGIYARSGCSWWVVGLPGEHPSEPIDARYARVTHGGSTVEGGTGTTWSKIELVTSEQAASAIRDGKFNQILKDVHAKLVTLTGKKVSKLTDDLWRVAGVLDAAIAAMTADPPSRAAASR